MPFGVEPDLGGAEAAPGDLLSFIQFMNGATALGGPDADTLIFGTGLSATRGTGATANEVTVTAESGGGAESPTLVAELEANASAAFDGADFSNWTATTLASSTDAVCTPGTGVVTFTQNGLYEVKIVGKITAPAPWPDIEETVYGSFVDAALFGFDRGSHSRTAGTAPSMGSNQRYVQWTDSFMVNITSFATETVTPAIYAAPYDSPGEVADMAAVISVKRLGASF